MMKIVVLLFEPTFKRMALNARILFFLPAIFAAAPMQAQKMHAFMENNVFLSMSSDTPYVETTIAVPGFELTYRKNDQGKFEGALEITLLYLKDTIVYTYDKYLLRTPEIDDTTDIHFDIVDLKRASLPDGDYTVQLFVRDAFAPSHTAGLTHSLSVHFPRNRISVSDIELVQHYSRTIEKNPYSKNGYDIHPQPIPVFPGDVNKLIFYSEIYHADKTAGPEDIVLMYSVKHVDKELVAGDLFHWTKQKAAPVNILFSEFNITELPTGNYELLVEVKSRKNELIAGQSTFFQRLNNRSITELNNITLIDISKSWVQMLDGDSMDYFMKCIMPKAELYERDFVIRSIQSKDTVLMKQFFDNFWRKRNPDDPVLEWLKYRQYVATANMFYSTPNRYGFETERGRVFLQYGPPNSIDGSNREPGAYPYEIWHYYKLENGQSNVKFVFCNSNLATNDYELIHSDARGELSDNRWQYKIYRTFKDNNGYTNFDNEDVRDMYGSQVDEYFRR